MSGRKSKDKPITDFDEEKAAQKAGAAKASSQSSSNRGSKAQKTETGKALSDSTDAKSSKTGKAAEKSAGKRTAKSKSAAEGSSAAKQDKKEQPGSKTPQVMKLVQPHGDVVNPVIIAGKSSIPKHLRGIEPLSRIMRREAAEVMGEDITELTEAEEQVTVNLTELVIAANAAEILRRFNACDCEKCVGELSRLVSEKVPSRFVRLSKSELEKGSVELDEQKEPLKKAVLSQMIRELMGNKKRNFHGQ